MMRGHLVSFKCGHATVLLKAWKHHISKFGEAKQTRGCENIHGSRPPINFFFFFFFLRFTAMNLNQIEIYQITIYLVCKIMNEHNYSKMIVQMFSFLSLYFLFFNNIFFKIYCQTKTKTVICVMCLYYFT
jgi:hypothetical protein